MLALWLPNIIKELLYVFGYRSPYAQDYSIYLVTFSLGALYGVVLAIIFHVKSTEARSRWRNLLFPNKLGRRNTVIEDFRKDHNLGNASAAAAAAAAATILSNTANDTLVSALIDEESDCESVSVSDRGSLSRGSYGSNIAVNEILTNSISIK